MALQKDKCLLHRVEQQQEYDQKRKAALLAHPVMAELVDAEEDDFPEYAFLTARPALSVVYKVGGCVSLFESVDISRQPVSIMSIDIVYW